MTNGEITLDVPLADLVIGSGGLSELSFLEPGQERVPIMTTSDRKPGLTCKRCSFFVVINDLKYTETECIVCRTTMPEGVTTCPKCGWTYEVSAE
jgi:hypothetical protein